MSATSIGEALFTKTQQRVLGLLYGRPEDRFYTNEIVRSVNMGRGTVRRELDRMVSAGLLTVHREGNQHFYQANPLCPVYPDLVSMIKKLSGSSEPGKNKILIGGEIEISRSDLKSLATRFHIQHLYLFGSASRAELGPDSDIDLLIEFKDKYTPSMGGMVEIKDAFEHLFHGRKVDIATPAILNNPYRKRAIEKDMEELYAA